MAILAGEPEQTNVTKLRTGTEPSVLDKPEGSKRTLENTIRIERRTNLHVILTSWNAAKREDGWQIPAGNYLVGCIKTVSPRFWFGRKDLSAERKQTTQIVEI